MVGFFVEGTFYSEIISFLWIPTWDITGFNIFGRTIGVSILFCFDYTYILLGAYIY